MLRVGGFDLAKTPAIEGADMGELTAGLDVDLGGIMGADLLAFFRVTFADEGRFMWIEPDPTLVGPEEPARRPRSAPAPASSVPPPPAASAIAPAAKHP
jgi:hypothetical protein